MQVDNGNMLIYDESPKSNKPLALASLTTGILSLVFPLLAVFVDVVFKNLAEDLASAFNAYGIFLVPPVLLALAALITGGMAIIRIRNFGGGGRGFAIAGLLLGNLVFAIYLFILFAVLFQKSQ